MEFKNTIRILAWALYDLANQFFALNIVSLYFLRWLIIEKQVPEIYYSIAFAVSVFFTALLSPVLGAISDAARRHRLFLTVCTMLAVFFTMALGFTQSILWALVFFGVANLGCQLASVFYNALMINIAPPDKIGFISGLGKMFSYFGATLSLYLIKPILLRSGYQATFMPTGLLFLVFALPCMLLVKDKDPQRLEPAVLFRKDKMAQTYRSLKETFFVICRDRKIFPFFLSAFFSLAAVNVLILFMSVYATQVFKLDESQIINLIGFAVFFTMAASIFSGWLSDRLGSRLCLFLVYWLWIGCFTAGALVGSNAAYYAIGAAFGIALGSTWVVVRAMAVILVPAEKIGEMFGLFNVVGYLSAIVGVMFWGTILYVMQPLGEWRYRLALLSLNLFMILGIYFLRQTPAMKGCNYTAGAEVKT